MGLDETSLAIGRLQATQETTSKDVSEMKTTLAGINEKLDKALHKPAKLSIKQWAAILGLAGGGSHGVAYALRKFFE